MRGVMLIFLPNTRQPEVREFSRPPDIGDLKDAIGGGWLEKVPKFETIEHDGALHRCVALCDEEAKLEFRTSGKGESAPDPANSWATILWDRALRRAGYPGLIAGSGAIVDYLCGRVCVLIGDEQFLQSL
jgi:hypothetical protein